MKGQSSVEYMVIFVILLGALIVASFMCIENVREFSRIRIDTESRNVLNDVAGTIDLVVMEGDGFRTNMTLPQNILGYDYEIGIDSNMVFLNIKNNTYIQYTLSSNITGSIEKGKNLIENVNGEVVITPW